MKKYILVFAFAVMPLVSSFAEEAAKPQTTPAQTGTVAAPKETGKKDMQKTDASKPVIKKARKKVKKM
ncbi:MAG: hypothetical protein HYT97_06400 [Elusimicrobia bacterium]|nr:hypothetical protein [Elusimicrobiota bacterium]